LHNIGKLLRHEKKRNTAFRVPLVAYSEGEAYNRCKHQTFLKKRFCLFLKLDKNKN